MTKFILSDGPELINLRYIKKIYIDEKYIKNNKTQGSDVLHRIVAEYENGDTDEITFYPYASCESDLAHENENKIDKKFQEIVKELKAINIEDFLSEKEEE